MYTHKAIKVVKNGINIKKYIFFFSSAKLGASQGKSYISLFKIKDIVTLGSLFNRYL